MTAVRSRSRKLLSAFVAAMSIIYGANVAAADEVDLELVLAADTSISINEPEYRLQMRGIANAFRQPVILEMIGAMPKGMAVTMVHWSVGHLNRQAIAWRRLQSRHSVLAFANAIERVPRSSTGRSTAIGDAIDYCRELIDENGFEANNRKIDVSGDARSNSGPDPVHARNRAVARGVTVNGLAISGGDRGLFSYYRDRVIGGPDAFVLAVDGFEDFESAIYQKLLKELSISALRQVRPVTVH